MNITAFIEELNYYDSLRPKFLGLTIGSWIGITLIVIIAAIIFYNYKKYHPQF